MNKNSIISVMLFSFSFFTSNILSKTELERKIEAAKTNISDLKTRLKTLSPGEQNRYRGMIANWQRQLKALEAEQAKVNSESIQRINPQPPTFKKSPQAARPTRLAPFQAKKKPKAAKDIQAAQKFAQELFKYQVTAAEQEASNFKAEQEAL